MQSTTVQRPLVLFVTILFLSIAGTAGTAGWANVQYILRTANNWRQPIKTFRLTVEAADETYPFVSFCFPAPVEDDGNRYTATARNFVPKHDLSIFFFQDERLIR